MDLYLTDDQRTILDALDGLVRPWEEAPRSTAALAATDVALDTALASAGFLDVAADPDLGTGTAALVIERLARLPFATDAAARAMFGPLLGEMAGTICLVDGTATPRLLRFLRPGTTVVVIADDGVTYFVASESCVRAEPEALQAYPMATLLKLPEIQRPLPISLEDAHARWRVGIAAEAAGLLAAALDTTVRHLCDREQFGRKLATFQALRHRLAEAQVRTNGVYWLAMKAAATLDPADAALAAWHAQEAARICAYDFHQFLGATSITLEHPLHLWTYRLKALSSDLGGRSANALSAANALWPA